MEEYLNGASKVFLILDSIKETKYKYIAVVDPKTGDKIMKIKLNITDKDLTELLDTFFDNGFKIESIDKEEFDSLKTNDIVNFTFNK
jgi:hypothetical protein